jgi:hypothetical protein
MEPVAERNRVTPFGQIVAIPQRGLFMGNRGSIHRGRAIVRPWQIRRWITCVLEFRGWVAPKWQPGRWTPLFFWDEAVALAAGHRPCALCRRGDFNRWMDAWQAAFGDRPRVDPIDRRLHAERVDGRRQRRHPVPWRDLPAGAFVALDDAAYLVQPDRLVRWSGSGYGPVLDRPGRGDAASLTPPSTLAVLRVGYRAHVHPSINGTS